jgi:hypothetical protein
VVVVVKLEEAMVEGLRCRGAAGKVTDFGAETSTLFITDHQRDHKVESHSKYSKLNSYSNTLVLPGDAASGGRDCIGFLLPTSYWVCIRSNGSDLPLPPLDDGELSPWVR